MEDGSTEAIRARALEAIPPAERKRLAVAQETQPRGRRQQRRSESRLGKSFTLENSDRSTGADRDELLPNLPEWRLPENASNSQYKERIEKHYAALRKTRESERRNAIQNGLIADPNKRTGLKGAIIVVGTCQEMCPEFERLQRIRENAVERAEKISLDSGHRVPDEALMIKSFHRSDAGAEEQLPSDLRPPEVLQKTLTYLWDKLITPGKILAKNHKFVWDRTRAIRNDFSIQQVSKPNDVKIAIQCFEQIARFHILSLHQLSRFENGDFVPQQEREQLSNTLVSLMYYYDDNRTVYRSPNEGEFRAYNVILHIRGWPQDVLERIQAMPEQILSTPEVQLAVNICQLSGRMTTLTASQLAMFRHVKIGEIRYDSFWGLMKSDDVDYLTACATEISFNSIRSRTLEVMSKIFRNGPRLTLRDFELSELALTLGLDSEGQTRSILESCDLPIIQRKNNFYLDIDKLGGVIPKDSLSAHEQICSKTTVEVKRKRRRFNAIIRGYDLFKCQELTLFDSPDDELRSDAGDSELDEKEDEKNLFVSDSNPRSDTTSNLFPSSSATGGVNVLQAKANSPSLFPSSAPKILASSSGQPSKSGSLPIQHNPFASYSTKSNPFMAPLGSQPHNQSFLTPSNPFAGQLGVVTSQSAAPTPTISGSSTFPLAEPAAPESGTSRQADNLVKRNSLAGSSQSGSDSKVKAGAISFASTLPKSASPTSATFNRPSKSTASASASTSTILGQASMVSPASLPLKLASPSQETFGQPPVPTSVNSQESSIAHNKSSLSPVSPGSNDIMQQSILADSKRHMKKLKERQKEIDVKTEKKRDFEAASRAESSSASSNAASPRQGIFGKYSSPDPIYSPGITTTVRKPSSSDEEHKRKKKEARENPYVSKTKRDAGTSGAIFKAAPGPQQSSTTFDPSSVKSAKKEVQGLYDILMQPSKKVQAGQEGKKLGTVRKPPSIKAPLSKEERARKAEEKLEKTFGYRTKHDPAAKSYNVDEHLKDIKSEWRKSHLGENPQRQENIKARGSSDDVTSTDALRKSVKRMAEKRKAEQQEKERETSLRAEPSSASSQAAIPSSGTSDDDSDDDCSTDALRKAVKRTAERLKAEQQEKERETSLRAEPSGASSQAPNPFGNVEKPFSKAAQPIQKQVTFANSPGITKIFPEKTPSLFAQKQESDGQSIEATTGSSVSFSTPGKQTPGIFPTLSKSNSLQSAAVLSIFAQHKDVSNPNSSSPAASTPFMFKGNTLNTGTEPAANASFSESAPPASSVLDYKAVNPVNGSTSLRTTDVTNEDLIPKLVTPAPKILELVPSSSTPSEATKSSSMNNLTSTAHVSLPLKSCLKKNQSDQRSKEHVVLDTIARDMVTGSYGLVEQFVEDAMVPIFQKAQKQVQKERENVKLAGIKERILGCKYLILWKENAGKLMNRRWAMERRKRMRESLREETLRSRTKPQVPSRTASPQETNEFDEYKRRGLNLAALDRFSFSSNQVLGKRRSNGANDDKVHENELVKSSTSTATGNQPVKKQKTTNARTAENEIFMSSALGASHPLPAKEPEAPLRTLSQTMNGAVTPRKDFLMSGALGVRSTTSTKNVPSQAINGAATTQEVVHEAKKSTTNANKRAHADDPSPAPRKRRSLEIDARFVGSESLINEPLRRKAIELLRYEPGSSSTTQSNRWRLIAAGIDPDTLLPKSKKRGRAIDDDTGSSTPPKSRRLSGSTASTTSISPETREFLSKSTSLSPQTMALLAGVPITDNLSNSPKGVKFSEEEEELFEASRKVRAALVADTERMRSITQRYKAEEDARNSETPAQRRLRTWKETPSRTSVRLQRTGAQGLLPGNYFEAVEGSTKGKGKAGGASMNFGESVFAPETPTPVMGLAALMGKKKEEGSSIFASKGASADDAIEL